MFARSLGEFGATIIVAGNIPGVTQTIPLAIYEYASSPNSENMALSLCAVSVILSLIVLILHEVVGRKLVRHGDASSPRQTVWRFYHGCRLYSHR